jgi:bilirubin oxidase
MIVQDKTFDEGGQLIEPARRGAGMLGTTILVNGTASPTFEVRAELTRLRLLNASTARSYSFGLSDDREFEMIASDGGMLAAPVRLTRIRLTPGERAEIVIRMSPDENIILCSYQQDLGVLDGTTGAEDEFDVLTLNAADTLRPSPALPTRLSQIEPLDQGTVAVTRQFLMRTDRINDNQMDMNRIDHVVTVDTNEIWEVRNVSRVPHNFHVHDVQFQVISIGGQPPAPEAAGWKDTVYAPPNVPIRLIMRFTGHTDPATPYMYHCHLLWHEDVGMMGQFVVVNPGQNPEPIQHREPASRGHRH